MFYFGYNHTDYLALLKDYAKEMHTVVSDNDTLIFPEAYASGYHKVVVLPNGLQALLINYTINQDTFINRKKSTEDVYVLRFEEIQITDNITLRYDDDYFLESKHHRATAILTRSLFDFGYILRKGTKAKAIIVIITGDWLASYLGISDRDEVLQNYLSLKTASLNLEPLDADYRQLINEALEEYQQQGPMKKIIITNRIMMLVERFFTRLYKKMGLLTEKVKISNDEIQRLMHIEAILLKDFSAVPPTIPELARTAAMSETKLKTLFKKVYDNSPYEYYQKNRMLKARYLLLTKQYSIKEVGMQLGFQNLSNLTIAFKKEFNMLPSEV